MKAAESGAGSKGGLLLQDGSFWPGECFGATGTTIGEVVFHTGHQGYQEILTDPSYRKQILVFASPQMGNQGFHEIDRESDRVWASGAIVRDYSEGISHWRRSSSLSEYLAKEKTPGLSGVDTRRLILHLRESGSQWGVLTTEKKSLVELRKLLKDQVSMEGLSLTQEVTTKLAYRWTEGSKNLATTELKRSKGGLKRVVVMDFGVKQQILRYLIDVGFEEVIVVPAKSKAAEILGFKPDALFLSNGPGDPAADAEIIAEVKKLIREVPTFGICLGHQILALALGLETFKLKFGHHGANHPVKNLTSDRVEITSQNHGFAVRELSGQQVREIEVTHVNLNDQTIEGFRHRQLPLRAIQFHPEASPGPLDSLQIFQEFQRGFAA